MPPVRTSVNKRASRKRRETIGTPSRGRGHRCRQSTRPRTNLSPTRRAPAEATGADGIPALPLPSDTIQPTLTPQIEQSIPGIPSGSGESNSNFSSQPLQDISCYDSVGSHVPQKIKKQIWECKFIDLSLLTKTACELQDYESQGDIQIKEGRLCIVKPKTNTILTIDKWTSAFIIFTSIMLEKFPTRAQELLKYLRDIRIAATRSNNWFKYDEQFRLKMANQPQLSWGQINQEFWLLYISNKDETIQTYNQTSSQSQSSYPSNPNRTLAFYCNHFNKGVSCPFFPKCKYRHASSKCEANHPSIRCSK